MIEECLIGDSRHNDSCFKKRRNIWLFFFRFEVGSGVKSQTMMLRILTDSLKPDIICEPTEILVLAQRSKRGEMKTAYPKPAERKSNH